MSPRKKKTTKKTPTKFVVEAAEAAVPDTFGLTGSGWVNPAPFQAVLEDITGLKTITGQLTACLDELQQTLPAKIGEARTLSVADTEKLLERVFEAIESVKGDTNAIAKKGTDDHNLNVGRIDQVADRAAAMHRSLIDENDRLAKRIAAINIDLDKHRRFHETYGAESINEATVTQAEKIANLSKVLCVGLITSVGLACFALVRTLG